MPRNLMGSREQFYDRLDREGIIEHSSNDAKFDDTIGRRWHAARPDELAFTDRHQPTEIKADLAEIKRIENSDTYQRERAPVSAMAENIIAEGLGYRGWLGPDSSANITSKYDDIKSGADLLVTIVDPRDPDGDDVLFTIDVTVSQESYVLDQKIRSELQRLAHNDRTKLKYFRGADQPLNRYVIAVPTEQVKSMADVALGRNADPTVEYQLQLELTDELAYQAFRQTDFTLRHYRVPGYQKTDDPNELLRFLENNWPVIEQKLPPEMVDSVSTNRSVVEYMTSRKQTIMAEATKKTGVTILDHNSRVEPNVAHLMAFDPDRILGRAA